MADGALRPDSRLHWWHAMPIVARIAVIYFSARVVTTAFLLGASALSGPGSRFGVSPSLGDLILGWDSRWYWIVAEVGYPSDLPTTDSGAVGENQWAFMPLYPWLARIVALPFGQWSIGAFLVSIVAGFAASVVLYRLLREKLDESTSMWAVTFFACGPLAALFQVGYAESLFLLWLFLALWCVLGRRYGWLYLLIPLMGYTRPGVLAFALFLGLYGIWRWFQRRREALAASEVVHIVALGLLAVVVGFSWQVIAAWGTGDGGAYLATELAWRRNWIPGDAVFAPFDGFLAATQFWFATMWGLPVEVGYVLLGAGVAVIAAALLWAPPVRRLGVEMRLWSASYVVYLLLVFFPQSSIFRLLIPLSPLWGAVAVPRSRLWRISVLIACLVGQWWWIYNMYALGNTVWQIP
ncbi:glycosyltransferase family 39 protein [Microbacterium sp. C7(2022)]|uniref:glycosyltransferase family 39 protein n=1 Tax=Microbacterium sp. C7(2022) TaxID=2992759 RepID=UPI00237A9162|nr:glycosyltransferase family 39 protein [Microbacterium sp. C7(2022)]MDE0545707.1 glycosyltransferase family 39 protein [Microbacterium sp. C7(2022)]